MDFSQHLRQILQPRSLSPPVQTLPTNDVDKVKLLSQIILREAPIQNDLPLLPQLIDRQKLLRSLISGPKGSVSSSMPLGILLNSTDTLLQQKEMFNEIKPMERSSSPSTSYAEVPTVPSSLMRSLSEDITETNLIKIDVVQVESNLVSECTSRSSSSFNVPLSRKRKLSDTMPTCSSSEMSTSPHLFEISEKNFTEIFTTQNSPPVQPVSDNRPNAQLITMLNRYMTNIKTMLSQRGISLNPDGIPVDYSSRPIDNIFKESRKQLELIRSYHEKGKDNL